MYISVITIRFNEPFHNFNEICFSPARHSFSLHIKQFSAILLHRVRNACTVHI